MSEKEIINLLAQRYLKMLGFNKDQHLRNMCLTIINKHNEFSEGKLNRWIGYIQKSLIDLKLTTISKENKLTDKMYSEKK
jgi:hypothetical protein